MIKPSQEWRYYTTELGICINEACEIVLDKYVAQSYSCDIQLVLTSPPFPLKRVKKYGNKSGDEYLNWVCDIGMQLASVLSESGSLVIEMGNAWNAGEPTYSTLPIETLLELKKRCGLFFCQEFIYYNPARLPGPIEWVNKGRVRVKDSFTRIWWLSKSPHPYADNRNVLEAYSAQMKKLLSNGKYNSGLRPSEHNISKTAFSTNNGGAIPSNVIIAANTASKDPYINKCKENGVTVHPARMASAIPNFFINFLTKENDIVLDCFSGSNTTGYIAETLNRRWISIEIDKTYYTGSLYRFEGRIKNE